MRVEVLSLRHILESGDDALMICIAVCLDRVHHEEEQHDRDR
jgi:hypothetical protein